MEGGGREEAAVERARHAYSKVGAVGWKRGKEGVEVVGGEVVEEDDELRHGKAMAVVGGFHELQDGVGDEEGVGSGRAAEVGHAKGLPGRKLVDADDVVGHGLGQHWEGSGDALSL